MKTLEQIVKYESQAIDGRDTSRLIEFIPEDMLAAMGVVLKPEYVGKHIPKPLTREAIIEQMGKDVDFGIEKYMDQRGLSTSAMTDAVRMWLWVLEDEGAPDPHAFYGGHLFEAVAKHYGFPVPDDIHDTQDE